MTVPKTRLEGRAAIVLEVKVADEDLAKFMGQNKKVAQAIRDLLDQYYRKINETKRWVMQIMD